MKMFKPSELDVLSRAFYRALDQVNPETRDAEVAKTVLMTCILDAARAGEMDEDTLVQSALSGMIDHEQRGQPRQRHAA
jgi:hypothetical protein